MTSCSCKKENPIYSQWDMWNMAKDADPSIELVGISDKELDRRILCKNYGPGCLTGTGKRIKIRKVELIAIAFKTEELAKIEAIKINQWYARNWLLDNVTNEPVLEDFVKLAFKASPGIINKE